MAGAAFAFGLGLGLGLGFVVGCLLGGRLGAFISYYRVLRGITFNGKGEEGVQLKSTQKRPNASSRSLLVSRRGASTSPRWKTASKQTLV